MTQFDRLLLSIFLFLLVFSPILLVGFVGMIVSIDRLRSHGKPAHLIAIGSGFVIASTLLLTTNAVYIIPTYQSMIPGPGWSEVLELASFGLWTTMTAVGIGIILWATTIDRQKILESESE